MAKKASFGPAVVARTTTATTIRNQRDLLAQYEAAGGVKEDLVGIETHGRAAEAANLGQSVAAGSGKGATADVLEAFEAVRDEYQAVMDVVPAVIFDLTRAGAEASLVNALKQVLVNEVPVRMVEVGADDAKKKKKARKVESLEAIRAEIAKDAGALLAATGAAAALAKRKVTAARLKALKSAAETLAGQIGERTATKGAAKTATVVEKAAVKAQSELWVASYRILASIGRRDPRVAALLRQAAKV